MKKIVVLMLALFLGAVTFAQTHPYKEKFHFSLGQQDTVGGYTQVIRTGNTIYVSGTVAVNITEKDVAYVYKVIEKSLQHFGASLQNVMKETIYTTDIESMKALNHVRKRAYGGDYPTSTWVQINRLFMPEAKLEIEVVAVLPENK